MANQLVDAASELWSPPQGRQNAAGRLSPSQRHAHRITDPRLVLTVRRANGRAKRLFDFVVALTGLIFLLPALITIALAVKLSSKGPILYSHPRLGRHGRMFKCHKFRSMQPDSAERLAALLATDPEAAKEWRETQKLRKDPRVTKIGAFLRKTSLDELPQLWNVLVGEMSLVGPRPITRAELERYGKDRRYYLLVRPGITGLWQVSGRSRASYKRRVQLDREYVERWTMTGDLTIMLKTVPAVLSMETS
ncbi:MAG: sugar transferase [Hyphomonadaceae bacterium]|nr:sugar transferase [Hyphomonadaceae bacterium]